MEANKFLCLQKCLYEVELGGRVRRTVCWAPVVQTQPLPWGGQIHAHAPRPIPPHPVTGTLSRDEPCVWWPSPLGVPPRASPRCGASNSPRPGRLWQGDPGGLPGWVAVRHRESQGELGRRPGAPADQPGGSVGRSPLGAPSPPREPGRRGRSACPRGSLHGARAGLPR